jgi:hypothetical protein
MAIKRNVISPTEGRPEMTFLPQIPPFEVTLRLKLIADKDAPLDFHRAQEALSIEKPFKVWRAGDPVSPSQQHRAVKHDAVCYTIEESIQDQVLLPHIDALLSCLESRGPEASAFMEQYSCELSLSVRLYWRGEDAPMECPWLHLSAETARRMSALSLDLDLDLYSL